MRQRGFTLIEVLVAMGITSLLALMLLNLFSASKTAFDHGATRMELTQKSRIAADRMLPFVSSAVTYAGLDGLPYPQMGLNSSLDLDDPNTWPQHLVFRTTEDFLSPTYDAQFAVQYSDLVAEVYDTYLYAVWLEGDDTGGIDNIPDLANCLVLGRLQDPVNPNDAVWLADPWAEFSGDQQDFQVLARDLDTVRFRRLDDDAVIASIRTVDQVRGATGQQRDIDHFNQAIIPLPSFLY